MSYDKDVNDIIKEAKEYGFELNYNEVYEGICEFSESVCAGWCPPDVTYFIGKGKTKK